MSKPSPNGVNGRGADGRFRPGWRGGPGNPHNKKVQQLRATLLRTVTAKDLREVAKALLAQAKTGNVPACKELLDRLLGKPMQAVEMTTADASLGPREIMAVVLAALADQPEARIKVAQRLNAIANERDTPPGGGS